MNAAVRLGVRSDHLANRHLLEFHALEKVRIVRKLRAELRNPVGGNVKLRKKTARCRLVAGEKIDERLGAFAAGGQCWRQSTRANGGLRASSGGKVLGRSRASSLLESR